MHTARKYENIYLQSNRDQAGWLIVIVMLSIGLMWFKTKPHISTWMMAGGMAIVLTILLVIALLHKQLAFVVFDDQDQVMTLTSTTLLMGKRTQTFSYSGLTVQQSKTSATFRRPTADDVLELRYNGQRLIQLKKSVIGEALFGHLKTELEQIAALNLPPR